MKFTPSDTNYDEIEIDVAIDSYTTYPDGSTTTVGTKKDGTKVVTETTKDGETTAEITVPNNKETEVVIPIDNADEVTKVVVTDKYVNETEVAFEGKDGGIACYNPLSCRG